VPAGDGEVELLLGNSFVVGADASNGRRGGGKEATGGLCRGEKREKRSEIAREAVRKAKRTEVKPGELESRRGSVNERLALLEVLSGGDVEFVLLFFLDGIEGEAQLSGGGGSGDNFVGGEGRRGEGGGVCEGGRKWSAQRLKTAKRGKDSDAPSALPPETGVSQTARRALQASRYSLAASSSSSFSLTASKPKTSASAVAMRPLALAAAMEKGQKR
jgi:hypothetical protein